MFVLFGQVLEVAVQMCHPLDVFIMNDVITVEDRNWMDYLSVKGIRMQYVRKLTRETCSANYATLPVDWSIAHETIPVAPLGAHLASVTSIAGTSEAPHLSVSQGEPVC